MASCLSHRGPDGEGFFISDSDRVGLGHRRLSIIDLSTLGAQPMSYQNERFVITFNGEIYNYVELKSELKKLGYSFKSETDTEVLLAAYAEYKENCLEKLDGMFAFAIWDQKVQELFCARDRFGEKPFYYYKDDSTFIFASEIKALWKAEVKKEVNSKKVYDYLLYGSIENIYDQGETFYQNVRSLEPGSYMTIKPSQAKVEVHSYWNPQIPSQQFIGSIEDSSEIFLDLLKTSVKRRMRSDVSIGSSLSGGLDSSTIVALVNQMKKGKQYTFSARFKNYHKDEGKHIQNVLNSLNEINSFEVYPTSESANKNFEKLLYHQDEPFGSMSINAQFEVMELASQNNIKVLLDGQGADEFLAGYTYFYQVYYNQLKREDKQRYSSEIKHYNNLKGDAFKFQKKFKKNHKFVESLKSMAASKRRKFLPSDSDFFVGINPDLVDEFKIAKNPRSNPSTLKDASVSALSKKGLMGLLRYADRNSMAHSIEMRLPFLYHELVEFVLSLPDEHLIKDAWTKYVLRYAIKDVLPDSIVWRTDKIGYEPPQGSWMKSKKFKARVDASVDKLKQEKLITKYYPQLDWNYLMIAEYL